MTAASALNAVVSNPKAVSTGFAFDNALVEAQAAVHDRLRTDPQNDPYLS